MLNYGFYNQIGYLGRNFMNLYQGEPNNPDLTLYLNETDPQAVEINEEEYQIYCEMGSSFQLCKVSTGIFISRTKTSLISDLYWKWKGYSYWTVQPSYMLWLLEPMAK